MRYNNSIEQFIILYAFTFYNLDQFFRTATIKINFFYFKIKLYYLCKYVSNKNFSNFIMVFFKIENTVISFDS